MKYKINLLPPRDQNVVDKAIYFSFYYLRYILVITQIIVIGVFFFRFTIDQEIIDLKDNLRQKQEIIAISDPLLKDVGVLEEKIKNVKVLLAEQDSAQAMFEYFLTIFPASMNLTSMDVGNGTINITGSTPDPASVKKLYNRLLAEKKFRKVLLKDVRKSEGSFIFSFSLANFVLGPK